jgi:hypothetical protein
VLHEGPLDAIDELKLLVARSLFKGPQWRERLRESCERHLPDPERLIAAADASDLAEGLYVKVEERGRVVERYKFIRESFLSTVAAAGEHWMDRPFVPDLTEAHQVEWHVESA